MVLTHGCSLAILWSRSKVSSNGVSEIVHAYIALVAVSTDATLEQGNRVAVLFYADTVDNSDDNSQFRSQFRGHHA